MLMTYLAAPKEDLDSELEVLQGICHAFGSAADLPEASGSAVRWIQAAVGPGASVRISLANGGGRLRTVAEIGTPPQDGRTGRRSVLKTKASILTPRVHGMALAVVPLVCRGESVGVLEVVASARLIKERRKTIEAVASQMAIVVRNVRDREALQRQVKSLGSAAHRVRQLVKADTLESATREVLNLCYGVLGAPAAAWGRSADDPELRFLGGRGIGSRRQEILREALPNLRHWESCGPRERARVASRFKAALLVDEMAVIDGGDAIVLLSVDVDSAGATLDLVGSLFQEVLRHLSTVERAERRNAQLDMGIAWTAHEVRGPLLAVKAAVDHVSGSNGSLAGDDLLSRSGQELGDLAGLVDEILRWAVGGTPLRRRKVDLAQVVREAVASCGLESGNGRLHVETTAPVFVRADPKQLRSAVSNVLRNALAYSPALSPVDVGITRMDGLVLVTVRDQGPGIPAGEREAIFDPFSRGRSGRGRGDVGGLGLFIARRVIEAHGGRIWADSNGHGSVFRIQVPATQ
jgi:signal transduction histidine kinase